MFISILSKIFWMNSSRCDLESLVIVASADDIQKMKLEMKTLGMEATYCVINNGFSI